MLLCDEPNVDESDAVYDSTTPPQDICVCQLGIENGVLLWVRMTMSDWSPKTFVYCKLA